jgi:hypothetical protein
MTDTEAIPDDPGSTPDPPSGPLKVVLLHQHQGPDDDYVAALLHDHLSKLGHDVGVDRSQTGTPDWSILVQHLIEQADAVIPLVSRVSAYDEVLGFEVEIAHEAARKRRGRPALLPVRINYMGPAPEPISAILANTPFQLWEGQDSDTGVLTELSELLARLPEGEAALPARRAREPIRLTTPKETPPLEPVGGAVPLTSKFYVTRPADRELLDAVHRPDSIVLIKGARQMGKTSLLARGLAAARERKVRVTLTDFQEFSGANLENPTTLYLSLSESLVDQLDLPVRPAEVWDARRSANVNFDRFLRREVLGRVKGPLVWGLDEVDRLLVTDYASEVFGLFRSWHNNRALDPAGPWGQLTLLISYATEAHLFITDLNQSPFNVGTRIAIDDFTRDQVRDLNERHGGPLKGRDEIDRFVRLVGGHPFLVRRGLHEIAHHKLDVAIFESKAASDQGVFGDHLRRILMLLARDTELLEVVRGNLLGNPCENADAFYRLRSAGVMAGASPSEMRPRCQIYAAFLRRHLL